MEEKLLLLGDQAVALGAIHAGITGVYAYPGTPSTEITEYIQTSELASCAACIAVGAPTKKRRWKPLWASLTSASGRSSA